MMLIIGGLIAMGCGIVVGFIIGGIWVSKLNDEIKDYNGPPVRWSPEEYEIIKRQTDITKDKDFADAPWTHPLA